MNIRKVCPLLENFIFRILIHIVFAYIHASNELVVICFDGKFKISIEVSNIRTVCPPRFFVHKTRHLCHGVRQTLSSIAVSAGCRLSIDGTKSLGYHMSFTMFWIACGHPRFPLRISSFGGAPVMECATCSTYYSTFLQFGVHSRLNSAVPSHCL